MWKDGALLFFSIITVGLCVGWFVTAQIIVKRLATLEQVADETHEQLARIQQTLQTVKKGWVIISSTGSWTNLSR